MPSKIHNVSRRNSPSSETNSPTQRTTRRSLRNNNQMKITSLFPSKRSASPSEDNDIGLSKKKKLKEDALITDSDPETNQNISMEENKSNNEDIGTEKSLNIDEKDIEASTEVKNKSFDESSGNEDSKEIKHDDNIKKNANGNNKKEGNKDYLNHSDKQNNSEINDVDSKNNVVKEKTEPKDECNNNNKMSGVINPDLEKCEICNQFLNNSNLILYQGHPQNSVEEYIALTSDKLVLSAGDEGDITERPQTNITGFSVFDENGHMCAIDSGLIEADVHIYMSGYLKSICADSAEIDEESVPVRDAGPIIEWFIHGFDGGNKNCITLSTQFGDYNLMRPSADYTPLMNNLYEKICISKTVVEYLEEFYYLKPTYEDLLQVIREATIPELDDKPMTEEMLHTHAQFVCDQVVSLEAEEDEDPLITLPCMRELIKLMGIKFGKAKFRPKIGYKKANKEKKPWTKATTTPLVRRTFEIFFSDQLDKTNHEPLRRKRCGVCEACQQPDCGVCNACKAMVKFGGHGRTKKACVRRLCPNMAVQEAEDSNPEEDDDYGDAFEKTDQDTMDQNSIPVKLIISNQKKFSWINEPIKTELTKVYYDRAKVEGVEYKVGDFVMVEGSQPNIPAFITRLVYMWREGVNPKAAFFHGEIFFRASDTVLGEVGDPREIFLGDKCCSNTPMTSIIRHAHVEKRELPNNWFDIGGVEVQNESLDDDGKSFYYSKYYEKKTARFIDVPPDPVCPNDKRTHRFCPSCERKIRKEDERVPRVVGKIPEDVPDKIKSIWTMVKWQGYEYKIGCSVFLKPGTFKLKNSVTKFRESIKPKLENVDEDVYTEYYRKSDNYCRGSNLDTGEPFNVGHIVGILSRSENSLVAPQEIYLQVKIMYRPENTTNRFPQHEDLNLVYWSDEVKEVAFTDVMGPCQLAYEENIPNGLSKLEWLEKDPSRMYFRTAYDKKSGNIIDVPHHATSVGRVDKGKDKGKGKGKKTNKSAEEEANDISENNVKPLKTLDVFAGCGGLSEGLHQAGIADCRWAIENFEAAAHAYLLNNKSCTVFKEDCNALLREVMAGATHSGGLKLPMKGEVELLCGGPPCQGFSGMNRFNSREYSNFKNSLVASYLSYCDYYRPKYFILENVRNFVAFKKGMVLKLTLRALLDMGYQCTFGILQAGNYGVPQTRRRLIILAAAPGYKLPLYPEPTHVFSRRACSLSTNIDNKKYVTNIKWVESAPRRTCTIYDAMSDLPQIANGANKTEIDYGSMAESYFQKLLRSKDENAKLRDHICKNMAPLIQARICRIPTTPGSDWRDLPNISVALSDGTKCKVLQYRHFDIKNGRSSTGALRGVCACASGRACDLSDKQENTLIPWCLPHTGNRHNNWAGLYGRVSWDGYFSTTVTDPEPMGKQGRVLHPEQNRVVSVRECARSQGFPDTYVFAGAILDKYRQIGNAVPPPLGAALGRKIKEALATTT